MNPKKVECYYNLGNAHCHRGELKEAVGDAEKAGPSYKVAEGSVIDLDWREGEDARVLEPSSTCVLFKLLHLQAASKALAPEKRVEADLRGEAGG